MVSQPPEPSLAPEADYNRMFKSLQRCAECPHRLKVILVGLVCAAEGLDAAVLRFDKAEKRLILNFDGIINWIA